MKATAESTKRRGKSLPKIPLLAGMGSFILAVLGCPGVPDLFAACPGDPKFDRASILSFTSSIPPARYIFSLNTPQIEAMRFKGPRRSKGMHNPGLTVAEHGFEVNYEVAGSHRGDRGPYCIWAESVRVDFSYTKMDVYVSSQYARGGCGHSAILAHEDQHVAINVRVLRKYKGLMQQALKRDRTLPTKRDPVSAVSLEAGKSLISKRINGILDPLYVRFQREVKAENAKIDTLKSYKAVHAKCKDW